MTKVIYIDCGKTTDELIKELNIEYPNYSWMDYVIDIDRLSWIDMWAKAGDKPLYKI